MAGFRYALLSSIASGISLASASPSLADGLTFTNKTTADGLGNNQVSGVYASGNTIYAGTESGLSIATETQPVPAPLPVLATSLVLGYSRRLRSQSLRLRQAVSSHCA